ncbi:MAG: MiaB/RimO family radical SAM methylthiotransferase [candidate division WOR-3 bacterium]|nr:MiaB/RimO family radical SAM methylthiotransferase [candidate division WOR-3 bacterium]
MASVSVINIGCRLNQAEGDRLLSVFHSQLSTFHVPLFPCPADTAMQRFFCIPQVIRPEFFDKKELCIINTCAVTEQAVRTSLKHIKRWAKKTNCRVIVTGCLASIAKLKLQNIPGVDAVITQDEKVALLENTLANQPNYQVLSLPKRTRPLVKIQDGCPNECSFCIVRLIRGTPRSRSLTSILNEIADLVECGYKEIVLTGLNLGAYGRDFTNDYLQTVFSGIESQTKVPLIALLKSLPDNNCRFRLSSIEPDILITSFSVLSEFCDLWTSKRLCRHLHIPLQSGDNNILKLMRRKYTVEEYCNLIDKVYSKIPDVNIGTDIIVGFPNEDAKAFENTLKVVESLPLGYLHIFPYSVRPQTSASHLPDNVPQEEKKERVRILRDLSKKKANNFKKQFIGQELEFLVEQKPCLRPNINKAGNMMPVINALSDNYIRITLSPSEKYQPGNLYRIKVESEA